MTRVLDFGTRGEIIAGRVVRTARFSRRSGLPVSAACVVANGVRETLCAALREPVTVHLLEPLIPDAAAWEAIFAGAYAFGVRGALTEAAIVLRPADASALVHAAFGERAVPGRAMSRIEERVLTRAAGSLAAVLAPVCGAPERAPVERLGGRNAFVTYFELLVSGAFAARIGIALARDPVVPRSGCLSIHDLMDVEVELSAEFAWGEIDACGLLLLQPNTVFASVTKVGAPAALKLAGRTVARGACGVLGGRSAFAVSDGRKGGKF